MIIKKFDEVVEYIGISKEQIGEEIGMVSGGFDGIHSGHIDLMRDAMYR